MLCRWRIEDEFTANEVSAARIWSKRQQSWGLEANLRRSDAGAPIVVEVFGPDGLVPHCIIYSVGSGVQVDEYDGASRVYPCLEAALKEVAPMW